MQGDHRKEERSWTQKECVGEEEESRNSLYDDTDVSNTHMARWNRSWWIRIDGGSSMRSARGRRRVWRADRRAAEEARDAEGGSRGPTWSRRGRVTEKGTRRERETDREPDYTVQQLQQQPRRGLSNYCTEVQQVFLVINLICRRTCGTICTELVKYHRGQKIAKLNLIQNELIFAN